MWLQPLHQLGLQVVWLIMESNKYSFIFRVLLILSSNKNILLTRITQCQIHINPYTPFTLTPCRWIQRNSLYFSWPIRFNHKMTLLFCQKYFPLLQTVPCLVNLWIYLYIVLYFSSLSKCPPDKCSRSFQHRNISRCTIQNVVYKMWKSKCATQMFSFVHLI